MIYSVKQIDESTYILNESVKLSLTPDMVVTAEYDDTVMTKEEVENMIDAFFELAQKNIMQKQLAEGNFQ